MGSRNNMGLIGCLLVVVMVGLMKETSGETYTVGDSIGWTLPPAGNIAYSTWSRAKSFDIGDVVVFQWNGTHDVAEVTKSDYDDCTTTSPINIYRNSPVSINLTTNSTRYFICTVDDHCKDYGQKVSINLAERWWDDWSSASSLSFGHLSLFFTILVTFFTLPLFN